MFCVTPQRTNAYNTRALSTVSSKVVWTSDRLFGLQTLFDFTSVGGSMGAGDSTPVLSRGTFPVLADGVIYFTVSPGNGYIFSMSAGDGKLKERFKTTAHALSDIAMAGGIAYVGATDGKFHAFDTNTKRDAWQVKRDGYTFASYGPVVAEGVVYFSGYKQMSIDSSARLAGIIYAVDAMTGTELWTFKVKGSPTSAAVEGDTVCFGDEEKNLIALDRLSGKQKWRFKASEDIIMPAIANETVFFEDQSGALYALDLKTGRQKWVNRKIEPPYTYLALDKSAIYFGGKKGDIFAVDAATGQQKWRLQTSNPCSTPVLAGGMLYGGCRNNVIYGLDAATGAVKWQHAVPIAVASTPVIYDGTLYYMDMGAHLNALR